MKFFGNVTKLEADIEATSAAMQADLEKAGITTAMRDGKTIPIAEASNAEKYIALRAAQPVGTDLQHRSQLLADNKLISDRLEKAETDLALEKTTTGNLARENAGLKTENATFKQANEKLTGELASMTTLRNTAVEQHAVALAEVKAQKTLLAQRCLAIGCLSFKGADGKNLEGEAALAEAMKMSFADLKASENGALNAAAAKLGVKLEELPSGGTSTANGGGKSPNLTEKCKAAVAAKK